MPSNINNDNRLDKRLEKLLSTYTRKTYFSTYQIVNVLGFVGQVWNLLHTVLLFFFFLLLFLKLYPQKDKSCS